MSVYFEASFSYIFSEIKFLYRLIKGDFNRILFQISEPSLVHSIWLVLFKRPINFFKNYLQYNLSTGETSIRNNMSPECLYS